MINPSSEYTADNTIESSKSDVAWPAIIAGALTAIALTLILTPLGAALGFTEYSPWRTHHDKMMTAIEVIWLVVVQWISSGMGGYLTGRLRTKWVGAHTHEVFRDTVHGFLAWALSAAVGATLIAVVAMHMGSTMMGHGNRQASMENYYTASLFRPAPGASSSAAAVPSQATANSGNEAGATPGGTNTAPNGMNEMPPMGPPDQDMDMMTANHILQMGVVEGKMSDEDRAYLAQLISARTGLSQSDATTRIDNVVTQQKTEIDKARKAAAGAAFGLCIALLLGAFIASLAGALGGAHRDVFYEHGRFSLER